MKKIDAIGKPCPIPVIEAKKALADNTAVVVSVDNFTAVQNLEKMALGSGYGFSYTENENGCFEAAINKTGGSDANTELETAQAAAVPGAANGLAVVIGRDTMGEGSEELGKILLKGFIYSLAELPAPPEYVIFYNSGARLTAGGANTVKDLKKLEAKGTKILTCGTCVEYYGLPGKPAVGEITNMYGITEILVRAAKVVSV